MERHEGVYVGEERPRTAAFVEESSTNVQKRSLLEGLKRSGGLRRGNAARLVPTAS